NVVPLIHLTGEMHGSRKRDMRREASGPRGFLGRQQALDALLGTLPDRFRQRRAPGLSTEADRLAQPLHQRGTRRAVSAVPLDRPAFNSLELAVQVGGDTGERRAALGVYILAH